MVPRSDFPLSSLKAKGIFFQIVIIPAGDNIWVAPPQWAGNLAGYFIISGATMTKELPIDRKNMAKAYDPTQFEEKLYDWWESKGYFNYIFKTNHPYPI